MPKRILIVDDSEDIREVLEASLKLKGRETLSVSSRDEALSVVANGWIPDLILLDYYMPGLEIEPFLKKLIAERTSNLPRIVLMTAGLEADAKARELGIPEVLRKPFIPEDVLTGIDPAAA